MGFPEKAYDRLSNLSTHWGITQEDVYYAIENDLLRVCVWLPLRYMECCIIKGRKFVYEQHEHKTGFIGVRPEDFHKISSTGCAKLRIFCSIKSEAHIFRLAYEPPQPAVSVRIHDLIVLKEDRKTFEAIYKICKEPAEENNDKTSDFSASPDYHHVIMNGEEYHLGDVQACIVQQLHDAAASMTPWVHGKTLLYTASSKAAHLRDVFKSKNDWRKIIISNGRGYYRLNLPDSNNPLIEKTEAA